MNLKNRTLPELEGELKTLGQPAFRAKQVYGWLHKGVRSYEEMEASVLTAESHLIAALAEEVASEQGRFVSAFTAELGSKGLEHLEIGPVAQLMLGPQA